MKLTDREHQLLNAAAKGLTDREISSSLSISRDTVSSYWRRILLKYGASSRTECVARYSQEEVSTIVGEHKIENERLSNEVREITESQAREIAQKKMLTAITHASLAYINGGHELKETFESLLKDVLELTESEYGFLGEVLYEDGMPYLQEHALTDISWDEDTRKLYKEHHTQGLKFTNLDTLFGHVMITGKVVISNDSANDPRKGGTPVGHPHLGSFLGIPVHHGDKLIGMIGLANRPGGYSTDVVEFLKPLVVTCANYIIGWRNKNERRAMQKKVTDSELLVRDLVDRIPAGLLYESPERTVEFVNQTFVSMFKIPATPDQFMGISCKDQAHVIKNLFVDPDGFLQRVEELLEQGDTARADILDFVDGRRFERDFFAIKSVDSIRGYLWCYRDVTMA